MVWVSYGLEVMSSLCILYGLMVVYGFGLVSYGLVVVCVLFLLWFNSGGVWLGSLMV